MTALRRFLRFSSDVGYWIVGVPWSALRVKRKAIARKETLFDLAKCVEAERQANHEAGDGVQPSDPVVTEMRSPVRNAKGQFARRAA